MSNFKLNYKRNNNHDSAVNEQYSERIIGVNTLRQLLILQQSSHYKS